MPKITLIMKKRLILPLLLLCAAALYPEVTFSGLDLSEDNSLLFTASAELPSGQGCDTLFATDLEEETMRQLSFYPERILYLPQVEKLQVQNRFGVFRTDTDLKNLSPVPRFPAFIRGDSIQTGKIHPADASPDGKYLLFLKQSSPAFADLVLFDITEESKTTITKNVELSLTGPNAVWSPDSKFFVYSKGDSLYYYSLDQLEGGRVIADEYRRIGKGTIRSVRWGGDNTLYYVKGSQVYQILGAEFFTRSIYSQLLEIGTIVGKVPFEFDPNFDRFWISPKGGKILLNKGGRNVFLYILNSRDYRSVGEIASLPYLFLPRNTRVEKVLWSRNDLVTILTGSIIDGQETRRIFRLDMAEGAEKSSFVETGDAGVRDVILSPDSGRVVLVTEGAFRVKKYLSWEDERTISFPGAMKAVWKSPTELILAGEHTIDSFDLSDGSQRLIGFSQIDLYGFSKDNRKIQVRVADTEYEYKREDGTWSPVDSYAVGVSKAYSDEYRVYLERSFSTSYTNMIKVRDNVGLAGTSSLFDPPETRYKPFPEAEEPVDFTNFNHGSRIRRREVSLVFNAVDGVEGLTETLTTLKEYDITATFFVNGEFIRRHPDAVQEIASSGHEVGSLFYTYFNMTDARFRIDKEYIKRGLARNEEDYFTATGEELSLLWHAPYYFVSSFIIEASREMNYVYVGRDVDSLDWVTKEYERNSEGGLYYPAPVLVEKILEKKRPGSIIPVRVGIPEGTRDDYLFNDLGVLINGFISQGYDVVPVSTLIRHAR